MCRRGTAAASSSSLSKRRLATFSREWLVRGRVEGRLQAQKHRRESAGEERRERDREWTAAAESR